ncbi:hypothetical protein J4424_05355 [Candidatus Woesearchaeota archaeon]|nr:hypothetical protein [Candidatus Woesearchaeota archaeon]
MELFIPLRNKLGLARKLTIKDLRKCREDITTILDAEGETIEEIEILSEKEGEYLEMACSLINTKNTKIRIESSYNPIKSSMILPWIGLFYIANTFSSFLGGITFHHEINPEEGGLAGAEIGMAAAYFLINRKESRRRSKKT